MAPPLLTWNPSLRKHTIAWHSAAKVYAWAVNEARQDRARCRSPNTLFYDVDTTIKLVLHCVGDSIGLDDQQLKNVAIQLPLIFASSLENALKPNVG
mmetsp:Transcript_59704/g.193432  ORF Transcript_59704/g.193432 Transcript_59704/m.193432 type:complete len:97 (-) Transcript_59704:362-652(-)